MKQLSKIELEQVRQNQLRFAETGECDGNPVDFSELKEFENNLTSLLQSPFAEKGKKRGAQ